MSYILDALKKADQEREQGQVPGLLAQQGHATDATEPSGGLSPLVWAGLGVALTLAGVLSWRQWHAPDALPSGSGPDVQQRGAPPAPPAPGLGGQPPSARLAEGMPPAPPAGMPPRPEGQGVQAQPQPVPSGAATWPTQPTLRVEGVRPAQAPAAVAGPSPEVKSSTLPKLAELPEALRKELPPLSVGGAMHSSVPAQRMLVLDGQVYHEGDSPQPGLKVEEIRLKSAVLSVRGQRFELLF